MENKLSGCCWYSVLSFPIIKDAPVYCLLKELIKETEAPFSKAYRIPAALTLAATQILQDHFRKNLLEKTWLQPWSKVVFPLVSIKPQLLQFHV